MSTTTYEPTAESPFAALLQAGPQVDELPAAAGSTLESPFAGLLPQAPDLETEELVGFVESLYDEDFADALEHLADEAAARHLADLGGWSGQLSESETFAALEHWVEPLAEASEAAIGALAEALESAGRTALGPGSMQDVELEQLLDRLTEAPTSEASALGDPAFEQFLGGLVKKAKRFAAKAITAVGKAAGKLLPIGALLKKLAGLVRPLLRKVLSTAIGKLPVSVRPLATAAAKKLGIAEAEADAELKTEGAAALAESFDLEVAALLLPTDPAGEHELEWEAEEQYRDVIAELEAGRERLAEQLSSLGPGESPAPAIQQFVPLVMAVRPLLKLGVSLIGRDRLVRFFGDKLGGLLKPLVGAQASALLGRPLADVGMRVIGFEHAGAAETLPGEALASTVEGAVLRTFELVPPEAQEDELQLQAALGTAFAEAAAAYLPDSLLRSDLAERETAGEGGVWVLMPRASRPRFRYRKFSRVYAVPVTRQVARAVPWAEGGSLESHLLERGVTSWPVQAEVDLYEALPGTQFGHLTQDESLPEGERPDSTEYQPLTPEVAGLLLGEPSLGRRLPRASLLGRPAPVPGRRYFRVRPRGLPRARPARRLRRVLVRLDLPRGTLRVAVRLSEREVQRILARLQPPTAGAPRDVAGVLASVRRTYEPSLTRVLAARLQRRHLVADAPSAAKAAALVQAGVDAALSAFLGAQSTVLAAAAQDPANGVVLTVTFPGVTRTSLGSPLPAGVVTATPGLALRA